MALLARQALPQPRRVPLRGGCDVTEDPGLLAELSGAAHSNEVAPPYVFVENRPLGGIGTVRGLLFSGQFEHLLRDDL